MSEFKIMIIDDDMSFGYMVTDILNESGNNVSFYESPIEALEILQRERFDLIITDYFMPEMTGEELIETFRGFDRKTPIILQTGYADEVNPIDFINKYNVQGYFDKTKGIDELILLIASARRFASLEN